MRDAETVNISSDGCARRVAGRNFASRRSRAPRPFGFARSLIEWRRLSIRCARSTPLSITKDSVITATRARRDSQGFGQSRTLRIKPLLGQVFRKRAPPQCRRSLAGSRVSSAVDRRWTTSTGARDRRAGECGEEQSFHVSNFLQPSAGQRASSRHAFGRDWSKTLRVCRSPARSTAFGFGFERLKHHPANDDDPGRQ